MGATEQWKIRSQTPDSSFLKLGRQNETKKEVREQKKRKKKKELVNKTKSLVMEKVQRLDGDGFALCINKKGKKETTRHGWRKHQADLRYSPTSLET